MQIIELHELDNIIDQLIIDDDDDDDEYLFNEESIVDFCETILEIIDQYINDYPTFISEPTFLEDIKEYIVELISIPFENEFFWNPNFKEEMDLIIDDIIDIFFVSILPCRSYSESIILNLPNQKFVDKQIKYLRSKPQPDQRTKEWYEFRNNLITASNAYKAFESESVQNQLIYEKCNIVTQSDIINNFVNVNTTLHWGQKYEKVSVMIYEHMFQTTIEDFGCIQHDKYKFLGASPDGINVDQSSPRYGRMLEIKNIINREIDGIPKKEYWIQMQLQMEVCNLNECDFLETKFVEYPDRLSYYDDTSNDIFEDEEGNEFSNVCLSTNNKTKGEIIYFHTKEGKPFYVYKPLDIIHPDDIENWGNTTLEVYEKEPYNYTYMKTIYWKIEEFSCVLVTRNRRWFKDNIDELQELWEIVEKERISGFEHRAPNRKIKKENIVSINTDSNTNLGCLLQFNKETGKITIVKREHIDF